MSDDRDQLLRLRHGIWIADLARAWELCDAKTDAERMLIASLLGFEPRARVRAAAAPVTPGPRSPVHVRPMARPAARPAETFAPGRAEETIPLVVVETRRSWDEEADASTPGPALPPETREHVVFRPAPEPLLPPQYERQILFALGSTRAAEGDVDLDDAIRRIARGAPLTRLRRSRIMTLSRGVELLVDRAASMQFFFDDERRLMHGMTRLVGADRLQVRFFEGCPTRGTGPGTRRTWRPYEPPAPGTKVVVVSDFGVRAAPVRGAATPGEWVAFAHLVRAAECQLLGLVPYPPVRWPRGAREAIRLVQWDRPTTFSVARRAASM